MLKIVVCVSGGGTNLQAIIDGIADNTITNTEIIGVISNNYGVYAMERAAKAGVPGIVLSPKDYDTRSDFETAFLDKMKELNPDLIVLAGFLVKIPEAMVEAFPGRIINIHPSLIPSFCGVGYYGLKVHEGVLARGVKVTGATVHFVDGGMDTGPIIFQKSVDVKQNDTAKVLQQRVMEEAEWLILPKAIDAIANGRISVADGKVILTE